MQTEFRPQASMLYLILDQLSLYRWESHKAQRS